MRKFTAVALATASVAAFAIPAFAQDVPAEAGATGDEEIVVQARRRDESIQDVPLSVQAVTGADLQKLEIRTFTDITKVVPGLQLTQAGAGTIASLRGISFDARASGASTSVEFYRNDAVITSGALFQATYDIGQIEVLRGPQGTLRGRASPSGSITVTTRRPDLSEPGGYVNGSYGSYGKWNFNAAVNVPIVADKLAIRVAGFTGAGRGNDVRGYNVRTGTTDGDIYDKTSALRASVRADPFDGVLVGDFSFETIKGESRQYSQVQSGSTFLTGAALSPRTITLDDRLGIGAGASVEDRDYKLYNWQVKARQWGQALTYVGSKTTVHQLLYGPGDNGGLFTAQTANFPFINAPAGVPITTFGQLTDSRVNQVTHEIRLQNEDRVAGMFDYVVGFFTVKGVSPTVLSNGGLASSSNPANITLPITVPATPAVSQGVGAFPNGAFTTYNLDYLAFSGTYRPRSDRETSIFGNLTVHLGDSTELSGGLRHIWFKGDSGTVSSINFLDPTNSGAYIQRRCYGISSVPGCLPIKQATIYAASLKHKFNDDIMAYFSFGTSWRPGNSLVGWGLRNPGTPVVYGAFIDQFLNLPDETSKSFEVGFKTAWFDRRLKLNVSAFHQKFNNYPLYGATAVASINNPGNPGDPAQALLSGFNFASPVPVTVKGVEAEFSFDVSPNLYFGASFAFADSQAKNVRVPCVDRLINATGLPGNDNIQDTVAPTLAQLQAEVGANQIDTCVINGSPSAQPRFSGTVQGEYSVPVSDWGSVYLRTLVSWKGASANDAINPNDDVPAYALVDLFGGVRAKNGAWEIGAFAKNLFNNQVVVNRGSSPLSTSISSAATANYNYYSASRTAPREVGVSLRYAFGSR